MIEDTSTVRRKNHQFNDPNIYILQRCYVKSSQWQLFAMTDRTRNDKLEWNRI